MEESQKESRRFYIIVDSNDNVATALRELPRGSRIFISERSNPVILSERIPFGHKFAVESMEKGEEVVKFGEVIGIAKTSITTGEHVHVHNVKSLYSMGKVR